MTFVALQDELQRSSLAGQSAELGQNVELRLGVGSFDCIASTRCGVTWINPDNVGVRAFKAGADDGLLVVIGTSGQTDSVDAIATGAIVSELLSLFQTPLLSEADIVPCIRRGILAADERIRLARGWTVEGKGFVTERGTTRNLRCLTASVAVLAFWDRKLVIGHVGENRVLLIRDHVSRRLTIEHTLANNAEHRCLREAGVELDPRAKQVVTRLVGFVPLGGFDPQPVIDVCRLDIAASDRIVIGNPSFWTACDAGFEPAKTLPEDLQAAARVLAASMQCARPRHPVTFAIVDIQQ